MQLGRLMVVALTAGIALSLGGCNVGGTVAYTPPAAPETAGNSVIIAQPYDAVWRKLVPALSRQFYVINNMDRASGLINVSYSGNPERFVDCGTVTSEVNNLRGRRRYSFPGSSASQNYELWPPGGELLSVNRRTKLDGRINIVLERVSANQTRVTANTRYVVTRTSTMTSVATGASRRDQDEITFDSGQSAAFAGLTACRPTGVLEQEVLAMAR